MFRILGIGLKGAHEAIKADRKIKRAKKAAKDAQDRRFHRGKYAIKKSLAEKLGIKKK